MSTTRTHPRSRVHFHRETASLRSEVLVLGSIVEKATLRAVEALRQRDVAAARAIDAEDALINRKRFDLEEASMLLMATQQPMASDLRQLAAIFARSYRPGAHGGTMPRVHMQELSRGPLA